MMRRVLFAALVVMSATTLHAEDWPERENLIPSFVPSADQWEEFRNPEHPDTIFWKNKADAEDQYVVSIRSGFRTVLAAFRDAQDAPGKQRCKTFTSTTIDEEPANGYPRLIWRALCERDGGTKSAIIHYAVQGNDGFYHVMKIWRVGVTDPNLMLWTARFKRNVVCDPRKETNPCPPPTSLEQ